MSKLVRKCAHCGSMDLQVGLNQLHCFTCGEFTWYSDGTPVPSQKPVEEKN